MTRMEISAIYRGKNTSKKNHQHKIYPYLLKGINRSCPNQVWVTDITFIRPVGVT